jgi:hypothetical protein
MQFSLFLPSISFACFVPFGDGDWLMARDLPIA